MKPDLVFESFTEAIRIFVIAGLVGGIVVVACFTFLSWDAIVYIRQSSVSEPGAGLALFFYAIVSFIAGVVMAIVTAIALYIRHYTREKVERLEASSVIKQNGSGTEGI